MPATKAHRALCTFRTCSVRAEEMPDEGKTLADSLSCFLK